MSARSVVAARFVEVFPDGTTKPWPWVPMAFKDSPETTESKALEIMRDLRPVKGGPPIKIQLAIAEEVTHD